MPIHHVFFPQLVSVATQSVPKVVHYTKDNITFISFWASCNSCSNLNSPSATATVRPFICSIVWLKTSGEN